MKRGILAAALVCVLAAPAMGWGQDGHRLVGEAAQKLLTHKARAHVAALLGNADLAAASTWADDLRAAAKGQGPLAGDPEAARINRDFPKNARWHFVDLPLGTKDYAQAEQLGFASDDDVVHAIDRCIAILDGSAPSGSPSLTKAEALKFLVHFVGDLHQPLHACSGYYRVGSDKSVQLVADPGAAKGLISDRGGNELVFGKGKFDELHALWDVDLVTGFENELKRPKPVTRILRRIDAAAWADSGDYHDWAQRWAIDTLTESRHAYDGLTFGKAEFDPSGKLTRISVKVDIKAYKRANEDVAGNQLAKAAFRLAELLNRIWE
jgi:hypothetical protein